MSLNGSEIEMSKSPQSNKGVNRTRIQRDSHPQSSMRAGYPRRWMASLKPDAIFQYGKTFLLLLLCFGFLAGTALSQTKAASQDGDNLYAVALSACVRKEFEEFGNIESSGHTFLNRIVEYDLLLTEKLPTQFGDFKIEYLNAEGLSERYKKTHQRLSVLRIFPMQAEGAILKISLSHHFVSVPKRRNYVYELDGGCLTEFKYDSPQGKFVLSKVELWGV